MYINIVLFLLVALVYSSAGFGGGSLYLAILSSSGLDPSWMIAMALMCNLLVSGLGSMHFLRSQDVQLKRVWPFILLSIPFSFWASTWKIDQEHFFLALASALTVAGLLIFFQRKTAEVSRAVPSTMVYVLVPAIGLIAGITGIGGGVYLSPLLYLTRWGKPKEIAGASALFIFVNSLTGLLARSGTWSYEEHHWSFWILPVAVLVGGWIGSRWSIKWLDQNAVRMITAGILLFAACRIFVKVL